MGSGEDTTERQRRTSAGSSDSRPAKFPYVRLQRAQMRRATEGLEAAGCEWVHRICANKV